MITSIMTMMIMATMKKTIAITIAMTITSMNKCIQAIKAVSSIRIVQLGALLPKETKLLSKSSVRSDTPNSLNRIPTTNCSTGRSSPSITQLKCSHDASLSKLSCCTMVSICQLTPGSLKLTVSLLASQSRSSFGKPATTSGWPTIVE